MLASTLALAPLLCSAAAAQGIFAWRLEFPKTDFATRPVDFGEIHTGRPRRDAIEPIHGPSFARPSEVTDIGPLEPVLSIGIGGDWHAYPLCILLFREIVNDVVGGVPVPAAYCPLCNSGVVYDSRLDGEILTFGNAGCLRAADMVMFDHETESWWRQFPRQAIIGTRTGQSLNSLPSRVESLARFIERAPNGKILVPPAGDTRPHGTTSGVGVTIRHWPCRAPAIPTTCPTE